MSDLDTLLARVEALVAAGRTGDARRMLLQAGTEHGRQVRWLQMLAVIEIEDEHWESAEETLVQALSVAPEDAHVWFNRSAAAYGAGKIRPALSYINTSLRHDPHDGDAHLHAALCLANLGGKSYLAQADGAVAEGVRLGGSPIQAAIVRSLIAAVRKDNAGALEILREALGEHPQDQRLQLHYARMLGENSAGHIEAGHLLTSQLAASPTDSGSLDELLRRNQVAHLRVRLLPFAALVAAGLALLAPAPWTWLTGGLGLLLTVGVWLRSQLTARSAVGEGANRDYLLGHPGLRWGRWIVLVSAVMAWVPCAVAAASGGSGPSGWATAAWSVAVALVGCAGAELMRRSALADSLDAAGPVPPSVQTAVLRMNRDGEFVLGSRKVTLYAFLPLALLVRLVPGGLGLSLMGLGLWIAAEGLEQLATEWPVTRYMRTASLAGSDPSQMPPPGLAETWFLCRTGLYLGLGILALAIGAAAIG